MSVNISKGNWFFIFPIIMQKHVGIGWKFQITLKTSITFILKHIFMHLTYFKQVDLMVLRTLFKIIWTKIT